MKFKMSQNSFMMVNQSRRKERLVQVERVMGWIYRKMHTERKGENGQRRWRNKKEMRHKEEEERGR
jgi:hypothetical protein